MKKHHLIFVISLLYILYSSIAQIAKTGYEDAVIHFVVMGTAWVLGAWFADAETNDMINGERDNKP
jgi:hypothetical protein